MKSISFALFLLVAGVTALPKSPSAVSDLRIEASDIPGIVTDFILNLIARIEASGLDPYEIDRASGEFESEMIPGARASGFVEGLRFTGLKNIEIINMNYNALTSTLTWNIGMPQLMLTVNNAGFELEAAGVKFSGQGGGLLALNAIGISGDATVVIDQSDVSVRNIRIFLRWWSVESALRINIAGYELSEYANNGVARLHALFTLYNNQINSGVSRAVDAIVQWVLNNRQ